MIIVAATQKEGKVLPFTPLFYTTTKCRWFQCMM